MIKIEHNNPLGLSPDIHLYAEECGNRKSSIITSAQCKIYSTFMPDSNNERSISSFNKCTVLTKTESKLFLQRKADKYDV